MPNQEVRHVPPQWGLPGCKLLQVFTCVLLHITHSLNVQLFNECHSISQYVFMNVGSSIVKITDIYLIADLELHYS